MSVQYNHPSMLFAVPEVSQGDLHRLPPMNAENIKPRRVGYLNFNHGPSIDESIMSSSTTSASSHQKSVTKWISKCLISPFVDQNSCGSCWAVHIAGSISDRYMIKSYKTFTKLNPTSSTFPHFVKGHGCVADAFNYKYMASPSHLLRNMEDSKEFGYQCCGGYAQMFTWRKTGTDSKIASLLNSGELMNLYSCPYNKGNDFIIDCGDSEWTKGWLPSNIVGGICGLESTNPGYELATDYINQLDSSDFCTENTGLNFRVDTNTSTAVGANEITDALLGENKFASLGPGSLVTTFLVPSKFHLFGESSSWKKIDNEEWEKEHSLYPKEFRYVYCYDKDDDGKIGGGHAVSIVGYINNVSVEDVGMVDVYIIKNSWTVLGEDSLTIPWGDDGLFLWATSPTYSDNKMLGMDSYSNGKFCVPFAMNVTHGTSGEVIPGLEGDSSSLIIPVAESVDMDEKILPQKNSTKIDYTLYIVFSVIITVVAIVVFVVILNKRHNLHNKQISMSLK